MNKYYENLVQEIVNNGYIVILKTNKDIEIMIQLENNDISGRMEVKFSEIKRAIKKDIDYKTLAQLIQGKFLDYLIGGKY